MDKVRVLECCMRGFDYGGAEIMVWNWYKHFDHQKILTDFVVNLHNNEEINKKYEEEINKNGGNLYRIYSGNKIIQSIKRFFFMRKLAKRNCYDVIHLHVSNAFTAYLHYAAVRKYCRKVIIHSHSSDIDGNFACVKSTIHKCFRPFITGKNIIRVACSSLAAEWMFPYQYYKQKKYIIIKNGIDIRKFTYNSEIRDKLRHEMHLENNFIVGHVGRFVEAKNHSFLIDIFYEIYKENKKAILLLIGSGELENQIRDKVYSLGLDKVVIFYGKTQDVASLYQIMDCFVFPSKYEGLPVTMIEAQSSGLKILCSDTITTECRITDLIEYISLEEASEIWSNKILLYDHKYSRKDTSNEIRNGGYEIRDCAKSIELLYLV